MRAKRENLIRNACCVVENTTYLPAFDNLISLIESETEAKVVKTHAQKALESMYSFLSYEEKRKVLKLN